MQNKKRNIGKKKDMEKGEKDQGPRDHEPLSD